MKPALPTIESIDKLLKKFLEESDRCALDKEGDKIVTMEPALPTYETLLTLLDEYDNELYQKQGVEIEEEESGNFTLPADPVRVAGSEASEKVEEITIDKEAPLITRAPEPKLSALDELLAMTGLDEVKEAIVRQVNFHKIMQKRRGAGMKTPKPLKHMLLTGNPGTGKTTVARLVGRIYHEVGLLSEGHFVETNRAGLVGRYIGESEGITSEKINEAKGGILFIDEIYSLAPKTQGGDTDTKDFGTKVIDTLMPVLSDPDSDIVIIGAGYTESVSDFLKANPGLASRFPMVLEFKDFRIEELMMIAENNLTAFDFELSPEARTALRELMEKAVKVHNHGNGRMAKTIVDNYMIPALCDRLAKEDDIDTLDIAKMRYIYPEDIPSFHTLFPLAQEKKHRVLGFSR